MEKKVYMTPDVEVIEFEVEDIMMASGVMEAGADLIDWVAGAGETAVSWGTKPYSEL